MPPFPGPGLLDNFNRADANTLNFGGNWSQAVLLGSAAIRVNANQAFDTALLGAAYWSAGFAAKQAAAFTFVGAPANGAALVLKASGGTVISSPASFIRVSFSGTGVAVDTTTNGGVAFTSAGPSLPATFAAGDIMTAMADANGMVSVWKTTVGVVNVTTYLGSLTPIGTWTGGGRIGMQLPVNARVDNFAGGTVP